MRRIRKYLTSKPHMAVAVPAALGFIAFVTNLYKSLTDGHLDAAELHQLTATAEAFGTVLCFMFAVLLKNKDK